MSQNFLADCYHFAYWAIPVIQMNYVILTCKALSGRK